MLVAPGQFEELFDGALREDLASSEDKKLLVFVSTGEADSVCATRILQVGEGTELQHCRSKGCPALWSSLEVQQQTGAFSRARRPNIC